VKYGIRASTSAKPNSGVSWRRYVAVMEKRGALGERGVRAAAGLAHEERDVHAGSFRAIGRPRGADL
jgi:hypothetical protein